MTTRCLQSLRSAFLATLGLLVSLAATPSAEAQSMLGLDPYRPYNGGYESFGVPPSPANNFSAINTMRKRGSTSSANQMNQFYDELYGPGGGAGLETGRRPTGPGVSYSDAYRSLDKQLGRVYQPNNGEYVNDAAFYRDQQERTKEYFEALRETDPRKRAERLRAVELKTLRAARAAASPNGPAATRTARPAPPAVPGATGAAAAGAARTSGPRATSTPRPAPRRLTSPGRGSVTAPLTPLRGRGGLNVPTLPGSPSTGRLGSSPTGARFAPPTNAAAAAGSTTPTREKPSEILRRALESQPATADEDDELFPPLFPRDRSSSALPR